jgi:hypothetical protein
MGLEARPYLDGAGTSRNLEVNMGVSGWESWGTHDGTTHEKLDTVADKLEAGLNTPYADAGALGTVGTSLTTICEIDCRKWRSLGLQISNTGAEDLAALEVQVKYKQTGTYQTRLSTAADYTTNTSAVSGKPSLAIAASGDLTTLIASADGWLELDVSFISFVRLQAMVATGTTDISPIGVLKK